MLADAPSVRVGPEEPGEVGDKEMTLRERLEAARVQVRVPAPMPEWRRRAAEQTAKYGRVAVTVTYSPSVSL